jgi:hypothetical protein
LAIDSVTFHFDKQDVRLHEVEIEQKSAEDLAALGSVTANLLKMYSPLLRPSESKLATGRAIQTLMQTGALAGLLDDANDLKPAAYDVIDRYLKRDSIWKRIWRWAVETA